MKIIINENTLNNERNKEMINSIEQIYDKLNNRLIDKSKINCFEIVISELYNNIEDSFIYIEIIISKMNPLLPAHMRRAFIGRSTLGSRTLF